MSIITYEQLKASFGGRSPAQLAASLSKNNIRFLLDTKGRPVTTTDAINYALGLPLHANNNDQQLEKDHIEV